MQQASLRHAVPQQSSRSCVAMRAPLRHAAVVMSGPAGPTPQHLSELWARFKSCGLAPAALQNVCQPPCGTSPALASGSLFDARILASREGELMHYGRRPPVATAHLTAAHRCPPPFFPSCRDPSHSVDARHGCRRRCHGEMGPDKMAALTAQTGTCGPSTSAMTAPTAACPH